VKVPSPEHLALLYLGANRDKDKLRLSRLMQVVSKRRLYALLQRFDDEKQTLARNLQAL
jgi:hypothetical protein